MYIAVARIGKPHGVLGQVLLELLTDMPEKRFQIGTNFKLSNKTNSQKILGELTLQKINLKSTKPIATFLELKDRTTASTYRDNLLVIPTETATFSTNEIDTFYANELVGLQVFISDTFSASAFGIVTAVHHYPAQEILIVKPNKILTTSIIESEIMIPFVKDLVIKVDMAAKLIIVKPIAGLIPVELMPD